VVKCLCKKGTSILIKAQSIANILFSKAVKTVHVRML